MSCFTTIGGKDYVEAHGYFSVNTRRKIPFPESAGYIYLVEHVADVESIDESRAYYRQVSVGSTFIDAVFTSTNVVKKVKSSVRQ